MKKFLAVLMLVSVCSLCAFDDSGCDGPPPSDQKQAAAQEQMSEQSNQQVGMPGISNFTEKKLVRKLYELRDQQIPTYAYVMDLNGRLFHVCDSIGYGLPYGVQFTNPDKIVQDNSQSYGTLPQSEPNGLFMPPTAEGTWVICADHQHPNEIKPVYIEPRVVVSPFPLKSSGEWQ